MGPGGAIAFKKIGEFLSRPSVIIVIVIVGVLVYVFLSGKKKGKAAAAAAIKEDLTVSVNSKLITDTNGKVWDPKPLTDNIYNDIYSWGARNPEPYKVLLATSDEKFKMVHNDWLSRFFDKDKETLKVAISNEGFSTLDGGTFLRLRDSLLARFTNLGLS